MSNGKIISETRSEKIIHTGEINYRQNEMCIYVILIK